MLTMLAVNIGGFSGPNFVLHMPSLKHENSFDFGDAYLRLIHNRYTAKKT